ncbi:MAG: hypothetical protein ACJAYH_001769 [Celeribacter sp.]|jgi:hypothetical protein
MASLRKGRILNRFEAILAGLFDIVFGLRQIFLSIWLTAPQSLPNYSSLSLAGCEC